MQARVGTAAERNRHQDANSVASHAAFAHPTKSGPQVRSVDTCADDGSPGSLRAQVTAAASGDVIDLSQLTCSTITLANSAIMVTQPSLTLQGPGPEALTIDGAGHYSAFYHLGAGTLGIADVTVANGYYAGSFEPKGGCIFSKGNVFLFHSVVTHCTVGSLSASEPAIGGGVYAEGNLTMKNSTITESHVLTSVNGPNAFGGGGYVIGSVAMLYSTISNNTATQLFGANVGDGGGLFVKGAVDITYSTISGNSADYVGGLEIFSNQPATIFNGTISGNVGKLGYGGLWTKSALTLSNSTIAFNAARSDASGTSTAGLHSLAPLVLQSSIIADNIGPNGPSDLGGMAGISITGDNNLITSYTLPPPMNTRSECPHLQPLADNGGSTRTHALSHTSVAIDHGSNPLTLQKDQRFATRDVGAATDIGSVEWQPGETDERLFVAGFDGLCDQ
jgi:hypothetical protein